MNIPKRSKYSLFPRITEDFSKKQYQLAKNGFYLSKDSKIHVYHYPHMHLLISYNELLHRHVKIF